MSAPVNSTLHRLVWSVLILVIAGLVIGFVRQQWRGVERRSFTRLEKFRQVPAFTLTERTGKPFNSAALKGKIWLADFFFTACPGPCLVMNGRVQEVQQALRKTGQDVQMVSFSINPEGDTPEVLRRYAERFHAETGKWFFLTGDRAKIYDVARNGFMLAVVDDLAGGADQKDETATAGGPAATPHPPQFTHSTMIALVDRQGTVRGYYDSTNPEVVQKLLLDIGNLLREQPRA